ncbi:MAG: leucine-rich repeat protein, partial [Clostridia bacterium]|nr:leucine-rich repeat protein [Clostridia bacterium]
PEALTLPDTVTTLGSNAFENAKGLESIVLPDGITEISSHCFYRAGSLQSVTLPETLTRIRDYAFDTTALTEIHFPETLTAIDNFAFSKCVGLTEIILPEGVTTLGHRVFGNIETPLTVQIPTSLVNDCDGPFGGSIIENIVFAEDITAIAPALFSWATLPKALTLPDTVTKLGSHAFENTKGLESIVLPDGITEIPSHCFYRAASLASVRLPNTLTNIRDYAFDTTALTEIDFPETLTAIENFAFSNCDSLTAVSLPAALTALGHQVFGNSAELTTLHCAADRLTMDGNLLGGSPKAEVSASDRSDLSRHAIEANLPLRLYTGTGDRTLLTADSDYRINANSAVSGNLVTLTVDFAFREPDRIRQARLDLWIPGNTVLVESTLLLNGAPAQQIDYDGDYTCIEIPKSGGTLQFCLRITEPGDIRTLACVNTNLGSEIVRVLSAPLPEVTMNTAERTSAAAITVTGIARADAPVTVYVDGVEAAQATANKAGSYSVHLTLPDVQDNRTYTVEARSGSASAARQVLYLTTTPILTEFLMYYNNHQNTCLDLLAHQDHRPSLPFNPSYAITLTAGFENGDEIETVWFTSSRNGTKKYFEAAFDGERYVAVLTRTDYTGDPGTLAVEYELRDKDLSMSSLASQMEEALAQCAQLPELEGRIKLREAELASTMIPLDGLVLVNSVAADMDLSPNLDGTSGLSMALKVYNYDPASNVSAALNPVVSPSLLLPGALGLTAVHRGNGSPLTGQFLPAINGQTLRFSTTDPETGKTYNVTFLNNTGYDDDTPYETTREVYAFVEDVSGSEIVEFAIDYAFGDSAEKFLSGMGDVSQTLGIINNLLEANDIQTDYDRMVQEIYRTVPPDQQEAALKEARRIRSGRSDYLAGTVVMGAMFSYMASAGLFAGPAGVAMAAMMMAIALSGKYLSKYSPDSILGSLFGAKWIQDPSGYVYEAVTTNRVEGVAATAFWIAEPEDADQAELEAFYAAKPDDARAGVPWNAVEYDQLNPLLTDSNGAYAWDVPCGWWQVRFEKDGYETTCSDWLPVPPPQLEVNVPIVSFEAPVMETVRAETDAVEVTFSKYMRPETVKDALTLNGQAVSVSWPTHETAADGTVYARTFTITPAAALPLGSTATVAVTDGARSYAGTPAVSAAVEAPVGGAPRLELRSLVRVSRDSTARVPFTLTNADPAALQVRCEPAALAEVTLDAQTGQLTVRGKLPGAATVTLWSEEAGLAETMEVRVEQVSAPVDPALNNPQWDSAAGTLTVTAVCDSDATVAAAVYSAAGQFLGLRIAPVVSGDSITLRNLPQGETCTVFLLDSLTHEPLCKAAGRHNTIE